MTTHQYIEIAIRGAGISLATYALIGQVVKPGLRMLAKLIGKTKRLSSGKEAFLRWLTRTLCIFVGAGLGGLPLWPEWFTQPAWGLLIGAIGGSMAPAIHHAVATALPERIKRIISGAPLVKK